MHIKEKEIYRDMSNSIVSGSEFGRRGEEVPMAGKVMSSGASAYRKVTHLTVMASTEGAFYPSSVG